MGSRAVDPELLDHLPPDDPEAIRSRRDLRRINALMGNEDWVVRAVSRLPAVRRKMILEIGAGEGQLINRLAGLHPDQLAGACDLLPAPAGLNPKVRWHEGDVFTLPEDMKGGILVANLFLHHFEAGLLEKLGKWCRRFEALVFNEPDRATLPHCLGGLLHPFINAVTRHDMHVSIRAGFTRGELPGLLKLDPKVWTIRETSTWRGSRRMVAWRN